MKIGDSIEFQWRKGTKWFKGRIADIQPQVGWKAIYKIEEFKKAKVVDWEIIVNQINKFPHENHIEMENKSMYKYVEDWFFVKWFSKDYIRKV